MGCPSIRHTSFNCAVTDVVTHTDHYIISDPQQPTLWERQCQLPESAQMRTLS